MCLKCFRSSRNPPGLIAVVTLLLCIHVSCTKTVKPQTGTSFCADSLRVRTLLKKGNDLYAQRSSMSRIGESLLYFDSANNIAKRIGDTGLLANTLFFIGNVYNAWNGEPKRTVDYYSRSAALFSRLPDAASRVREFYLRYLVAHSYDGEKANDSSRCAETIIGAIKDLAAVPQFIKDSMDYLPDFAWVATNIKNYGLAEQIIKGLSARAANDPESNNYLDHYFLTKARIDIFYFGRKSAFTDSIVQALRVCNNRFDSGYYAHNLSLLFEATGDYKSALYFSRLSTVVQSGIEKSDILSALRTRITNTELRAEREKQKRSREEIRVKNLYLYAAGLAVIIVFLSGVLYSIYQKRKAAQLQVKQQELFTGQLLQKEEDERKRIAMELHDGINHDLLTVKNNLILNKLTGVADIENIIRSVRDMSRNLYPALFESVGLLASVEALCTNITEAGFFTTCDIQYKKALGKEEELQLYRIIQEALQNASRHAQAIACKITIRSHEGYFLAEIKDNGRGFDTSITPANSFGLQSMRQRAKAIGAELQVKSTESGTIITIAKNQS